MDQEQYIRPGGVPPQLTRADLATLTPEQVVRADELGQCEVIKNGREPIPAEVRGERFASEQEDAQARADQAEAERIAANQHRSNIARAIKIGESL